MRNHHNRKYLDFARIITLITYKQTISGSILITINPPINLTHNHNNHCKYAETIHIYNQLTCVAIRDQTAIAHIHWKFIQPINVLIFNETPLQ